MFFSPVGLGEDGVEVLQIDGTGLITDRFDQRAEAEVAGVPQDALAGTDDESEGFGGKSSQSSRSLRRQSPGMR
jgi:hypothetical protein